MYVPFSQRRRKPVPPHALLLAARIDVPEAPLLNHPEKVKSPGSESLLFFTRLGTFTPIVLRADLFKPPPTRPLPAVAVTPPPFATASALGDESLMPEPPWITVTYFVHTFLAVTAGNVAEAPAP